MGNLVKGHKFKGEIKFKVRFLFTPHHHHHHHLHQYCIPRNQATAISINKLFYYFWNKQNLSHSYPFKDLELKQTLLNGVFSPDMDKKNTSSIRCPACWFLLLCCWSHTRHSAAGNANKQPISKKSHGHMSPHANFWLVYKITKYFKIRGNGETAKKVV